ncbi:ABC transporter permease [Pseudonocardia sp. KRD291]|uniref:ABC transporter permease n=1 Tax=Pseudonocardia sp. KRD291 TaxID=2792007 RepID=UPI001C4A3502|nr:ABC transporter permease [Pseudonocardia sp. KRD291]MBW0105489.1 ABC transporter permease [Pseudonocardia sp. KRD291]
MSAYPTAPASGPSAAPSRPTVPATVRPRHTGTRAALSDAATLIGRSVRLTRRDVEMVVLALVLPLMMMLLFVYVFGGAIETGGAYLDYVVPGIVLLCAGFGAASTAPAVAHDMTGGMIDRLRSMPIRPSALLVGHVTASVARNAVATAVVVVVALLMGFRPAAGPLGWLAAAAVVLGYVLALSWLAAALGTVARSVQGANGATFVMLFLPYLSSAFVPVQTMPAFLVPFARYQPVTPVIETVRALLAGLPAGPALWSALAWEAGLLLASFALAAALFRRRTRG